MYINKVILDAATEAAKGKKPEEINKAVIDNIVVDAVLEKKQNDVVKMETLEINKVEEQVDQHIKDAAEKRLNQWFDKKFKGKAVCPFCGKSSGTTKKYSDRMLHISIHPEFQKMLDVKRKSMEARATLKEAKERAAAYAKNIKKSQSKEAKNIKS